MPSGTFYLTILRLEKKFGRGPWELKKVKIENGLGYEGSKYFLMLLKIIISSFMFIPDKGSLVEIYLGKIIDVKANLKNVLSQSYPKTDCLLIVVKGKWSIPLKPNMSFFSSQLLPNAQITIPITASVHLHATGVAAYMALLTFNSTP